MSDTLSNAAQSTETMRYIAELNSMIRALQDVITSQQIATEELAETQTLIATHLEKIMALDAKLRQVRVDNMGMGCYS